MKLHAYTDTKPRRERIPLIDELRGFAIILMLVYHFLYSLLFVFGANPAPWVLPAMLAVQPFGAGLFILIAGFSSCHSRSNVRRGLRILLAALLISLATRLFLPSQTIYFGVLHFHGTAILLYEGMRRPLERIRPARLAGVAAGLFFLLRRLPEGLLLLPLAGHVNVPSGLYTSFLLAPLGLPPAGFASADYFPLLPWFMLFLAGTAIGRHLRSHRLPERFYRRHAPVLSRLGRHALPVYLLHQPAILALIWLAYRLA